MKKALLYSVLALLISSGTHFACSNSGDEEPEKGEIDKITDQAAKDIADSIQDPLEKARAAKELLEQVRRDMEKALEENKKE